ncbi:hypothetical protein ACKF11_12945 [Methylobacillus sp. Pita2]|uniref:hypothetical protein n=1 Tax=Methylobacillus sp. Pita2 TaxID=3383245 RepID=UPI0038B5ACD7
MSDLDNQVQQHQAPKKLSWIRRKIIEGADIQLNPERQELKGMVKDSFSISPLYLPKVKFWNSPDTKTVWRAFCRLILKYSQDHEPRNESFNKICQERGVTEEAIVSIERSLKWTSRIALGTALGSVILAAWYGSLTAWLVGIGSAFMWGTIWWKYSFRLWQIRMRSLDINKASVKKFMEGEWYLEALK